MQFIMNKKRRISKKDIYLKARMMVEGIKVNIKKEPYCGILKPYSEPFWDVVSIHKDNKDSDELLEKFLELGTDFGEFVTLIGDCIVLDGSKITTPILINKESQLEAIINDTDVIILEQGKEITTGKYYTPRAGQPWSKAYLSNGIHINNVLPGMSSSIINVIFNPSCYNYNSGKGCKYCSIFTNDVSAKLYELPLVSLKKLAKLNGEALKIITDSEWRGALAITGGAFIPSQRNDYLDRLEIILDAIRNAVGDRVMHELVIAYNHYPPEDFSDMYKWQKLGINHSSIDLEVVNPKKFAEICPGKHEYKPYEYWKESVRASTEVFGPYIHTTTNLVIGIEPISELLEGVEEILSFGATPIPLTLFPNVQSRMANMRVPSTEWLLEATNKMADIFNRYRFKILKQVLINTKANIFYHVIPNFLGRKRGYPASITSTWKSMGKLNHLNLLFDEVLRLYQKKVPGLKNLLPIPLV